MLQGCAAKPRSYCAKHQNILALNSCLLFFMSVSRQLKATDLGELEKMHATFQTDSAFKQDQYARAVGIR